MNIVLKIIKKIWIICSKCMCCISKKITELSYKSLFVSEWFFDEPDYFDHEIDLYYKWKKQGSQYWIERGVYNSLAIMQYDSPRVIDLCCGDGFFTDMFYSNISVKVWGYDYNKQAITKAKKSHLKDNITYQIMDLTKDFPACEGVTNIIFDAALEYFTQQQTETILDWAQSILSETGGMLSGTCPLNDSIITKNTFQIFGNSYEIKELLKNYFKYVYVIETRYEEKNNVHFFASNTKKIEL